MYFTHHKRNLEFYFSEILYTVKLFTGEVASKFALKPPDGIMIDNCSAVFKGIIMETAPPPGGVEIIGLNSFEIVRFLSVNLKTCLYELFIHAISYILLGYKIHKYLL